MLKKCSISLRRCFGRSPMSSALSHCGSCSKTVSNLASSPASSRMKNTPRIRARTTQPGNVGSATSTNASSGSPSFDRVSGTKP